MVRKSVAVLIGSGWCICGCWFAGCAVGNEAQLGNLLQLHRHIQDRTQGVFDNAAYFKPNEGSGTPLFFQLAPLIVQEIGSAAERAPMHARIAGVEANTSRRSALGVDKPVVYTESSTAVLNGHEFQQVAYRWMYPHGGGAERGRRYRLRGYRMTLDENGFPFIWEVLDDDSNAIVLYVSRYLEDRAVARFGGPEAGRRYTVERPVDETPKIVVARLLDDGPQPMGPFVYVALEDLGVMTLTCRCMPSQVRYFSESVEYDLAPMPDLFAFASDKTSGSGLPVTGTDPSGTEGPRGDPAWLAACLRLPDSPSGK